MENSFLEFRILLLSFVDNETKHSIFFSCISWLKIRKFAHLKVINSVKTVTSSLLIKIKNNPPKRFTRALITNKAYSLPNTIKYLSSTSIIPLKDTITHLNLRFETKIFPKHLKQLKIYFIVIEQLNFPSKLKTLIFNESVRCKLIFPDLTFLKFVTKISRTIAPYPKTLKYLIITSSVNIGELPKSLIFLSINYPEIKPLSSIVNFPKVLKTLCLSTFETKEVFKIDIFHRNMIKSFPPYFPENLDILKINGIINFSLVDLPDSLRKLFISENSEFDAFIKFPKNLTYINILSKFNQPIVIFSSLKVLNLGRNFDQEISSFPETLEYLKVGSYYDRVLPKLPIGLKYLRLGYYFNQPLVLPDELERLELGYCFNKELVLPGKLEYLRLEKEIDVVFPLSLKTLVVKFPVKKIPHGLEVLVSHKYLPEDDFSNLRLIKLRGFKDSLELEGFYLIKERLSPCDFVSYDYDYCNNAHEVDRVSLLKERIVPDFVKYVEIY